MHFQMNIYSAAVTLFLVMDPMGNIPVFLSLLKQVDPKRRTKIILREGLIAFAILTLFLFCGKPILTSLHISEGALGIAGEIILFLIAIKMLFPVGQKIVAQTQGEPFIVPMAIPLLTGPSSMTTVILFASQAPQQMGKWFIALAFASLVAILILLMAVRLQISSGASQSHCRTRAFDGDDINHDCSTNVFNGSIGTYLINMA